jgi:hypothetical protein
VIIPSGGTPDFWRLYRAVGKFSGSAFLWEWIGTHEEYNKRF